MAVNSSTSFVISSILTLLLFSGMQMYKPLIVKSPITTVFGGFLGSVLFILFLTAIGNLETTIFGSHAQVKLPEVVICLLIALIASGMVHRICFTTCFIFSMVGLYYMVKISQKTYGSSVPATAAVPVKSRRHK